MIDKQQEKTVNADALPKDGGVGGSAAEKSEKTQQIEVVNKNCSDPSAAPTISKGEKAFNWTTYTGLNYWVNLASSIAIADHFTNPESKGRAKLDNAISKTTQFITKFNVLDKTAHHNTKIALETLVLTSGGLLLLAPLKWMEDNKRSLVHKINKKLGVNQTATDGHEKTPDEIYVEKEQPKQSWGNVIWRRIEGTAAVIVAGMGLDHFARNKDIILPKETVDLGWTKFVHDEKVQGGKERVAKKAFEKINGIAKVIRGKEFKTNGVVSRWTKLAILDSVFTAITAVVMKVTSGAKKAKMPQEIDDSKDSPVVNDAVNRITTAADVERNNRLFASKVEKRVKGLIDYKHGGVEQSHSFAEHVQPKDAPLARI